MPHEAPVAWASLLRMKTAHSASPGRPQAAAPSAVRTSCPASRWSILTGFPWRRLVLLWGLLCTLEAVTLQDLRNDPNLTPERFARYFRNFRYVFHEEIQPPEVFLATESGDCDDYATLAADLFAARGYHPRLIAVRMPGVTHVVCYLNESGCFLDFNNRVYLSRTERAKPDIRDIARKVAKSFDASWTSASEFTYSDGLKRMVATVTQTETYTAAAAPPATATASTISQIKIDF